MYFSPKCRTKKLGMINTILGSFFLIFVLGRGRCSALNQALENP